MNRANNGTREQQWCCQYNHMMYSGSFSSFQRHISLFWRDYYLLQRQVWWFTSDKGTRREEVWSNWCSLFTIVGANLFTNGQRESYDLWYFKKVSMTKRSLSVTRLVTAMARRRWDDDNINIRLPPSLFTSFPYSTMSSHQDESIASEVLAASLGGAVSASILYPLEGMLSHGWLGRASRTCLYLMLLNCFTHKQTCVLLFCSVKDENASKWRCTRHDHARICSVSDGHVRPPGILGGRRDICSSECHRKGLVLFCVYSVKGSLRKIASWSTTDTTESIAGRRRGMGAPTNHAPHWLLDDKDSNQYHRRRCNGVTLQYAIWKGMSRTMFTLLL